ncbi:type I restriction enzyme, S subunit [Algoriphagus ornithinivorans]|uniref:Type I restriction enzyme, S subunit n=1 Tax=Algoriphagus ornithinivorans TaxID=226506 RepID=A0A1I5GY28_9BACT|nr:restriction endonuclease subunit S [Algoriphagus ornithinivorans]SFO40869.1 type I restriction enzyme, S subunit [Algoriphagus ornithinivorans]
MKFIYETLGNLTFNLDNKRVPLNSRERSEKKKIGLYPYFGANNILDYIDEYIFDEKILCIAEDGGSWGSQERCSYIVNEKCWVNNHAHVLKENGKAHLEYLYFYLNHANLNKYITGTTRGKLTRRELEKIIIPLPPTIEDQKRIAKILSECEALIQKRKDSIGLLDELLRSTFLEMFGDPVRNEKEWEMVSLSKFGTIDRGVSKHRPRNAPKLLNGPYPLVQTGDVANSGTYIATYKQTYSELGLKQSKMWPAGTLCITIAANIAKTGILAFNACFPDSVVGFVVDPKEATNLYVHHLFSFFQRILEKNAPSAAQKNINLNILRNFKVPQPPVELQLEFDEIVLKVEKIKIQFQSSLKELQNLYGSLSQRAFKGELDLSKVDISDMEDSTQEKPEMEPIGDPRWEGKVELQDYQVHIDEIIRKDFENISFSFKQLESAIADRGVYVPYEGVKEFVFKSLEGNESLLVQELDEKDKQIVFKIRS